MEGYMYMLRCCDDTYYAGSTIDLEGRVQDHMDDKGSNYTRKRLPVSLAYHEKYSTIKEAYYREKQVQKWTFKKKHALVEGRLEDLQRHADCQNDSHFKNKERDEKGDEGYTVGDAAS